jgi:hypothetical protein
MAKRGVLGGAALSRQLDDFFAWCRKDIRAEKFFRRRVTEAVTPERKREWIAIYRQYKAKHGAALAAAEQQRQGTEQKRVQQERILS